MAKKCKGCYFHRDIGGKIMACHYLLVTGNLRGCKAEDCTFKQTEQQYLKAQKERIYNKINNRYKEGATVKAMEKEFCLSSSTILKVIREIKENEAKENKT